MKKRLLSLQQEYKERGIKNLYYVKHSNPDCSWYCGYVTVGKDHPLYDSDDVESTWAGVYHGLDIHGGITFASLRREDEELTIGFDQNHSGDMSTKINDDDRYVASETHHLARQLCEMYDSKKGSSDYRKKVTDWYIDEFLEMKDDTVGISDHLEHIINEVSDEYFAQNIETMYEEEMVRLKVEAKDKCLLHYFSGSDQEQESTLISLGQRVRDALYENGEFFINADQIAMECECEECECKNK